MQKTLQNFDTDKECVFCRGITPNPVCDNGEICPLDRYYPLHKQPICC